MIKYAIDQHATAFPSKVLARDGGRHILNITLTADHDNGEFVGKGKWLELDRYEEGVPTSVEGIVQGQADNGEYYVEIVDAKNAYFVYQVPMIEETYNNNFKKESNFFNYGGKKADNIEGYTVRCYELAPLDIVAISEAGFNAKPTIGATVTLTGNKLG